MNPPCRNKSCSPYTSAARAPKCNTELHDVVFVVGTSIEATYEQLMEKWFGDPLRLHIDSWSTLNSAPSMAIAFALRQPSAATRTLLYQPVCTVRASSPSCTPTPFWLWRNEQEVKALAERGLLVGAETVHTDDLFDLDYCLPIESVDGYHVQLEPAGETVPLSPHSGYHIIPKFAPVQGRLPRSAV